MSSPSIPGSIAWVDLTVPNATEVADFYCSVVGWTRSEISMGEYSDYCVHTSPGSDAVAGICHARGKNLGVPAQWLMYLQVADLNASLAAVEAKGGKILRPALQAGKNRFAIVEDPAGAVVALFGE